MNSALLDLITQLAHVKNAEANPIAYLQERIKEYEHQIAGFEKIDSDTNVLIDVRVETEKDNVMTVQQITFGSNANVIGRAMLDAYLPHLKAGNAAVLEALKAKVAELKATIETAEDA